MHLCVSVYLLLYRVVYFMIQPAADTVLGKLTRSRHLKSAVALLHPEVGRKCDAMAATNNTKVLLFVFTGV